MQVNTNVVEFQKIEFSQNDPRDETKKMPLEDIFQKSCF